MDDFLLVAKWLGIIVFVVIVLAGLGAFVLGMYKGARGEPEAADAADSDSSS